MTDKTLTCRDCNSTFVFTENEQAFYKEKGFENEPQRCPDCRAERKRQRGESGGGYGNSQREMFPAVCTQCGKDTSLPFKPTGDKPVFCRECYQSRSGR